MRHQIDVILDRDWVRKNENTFLFFCGGPPFSQFFRILIFEPVILLNSMFLLAKWNFPSEQRVFFAVKGSWLYF